MSARNLYLTLLYSFSSSFCVVCACVMQMQTQVLYSGMVSAVEEKGVGERVGSQSRQGNRRKEKGNSNRWQGGWSRHQIQGRGRAGSFLQVLI